MMHIHTYFDGVTIFCFISIINTHIYIHLDILIMIGAGLLKPHGFIGSLTNNLTKKEKKKKDLILNTKMLEKECVLKQKHSYNLEQK